MLGAGALVLLMATMALAGCGGGSDETLAADVDFPQFVYRSEDSLKGYRIAATYPEALEAVPCYCGCEQNPEKYQNLKDCFIDRKTGDFDEHAAGCAICLEEAIDIGEWMKEDLSLREIRDRIDEAYEGRGKPTDTPMPSE